MKNIKAVFFDQDGVIIDTERDGHRVAFNKTFKEFGFNFSWSVEEYHKLLQVGGGKERMKHYFNTVGFGQPVKDDEVDEIIKNMHLRKTELFVQLLIDGELPLRPGIHRMMQEVRDAGLTIGICTTSNEKTAETIVSTMLSDIPFAFVLAGDVVKKKKPDPAIYLLALEKSGFSADECLVFEDSHIGVTAAKAAGMNVIATTNIYTKDEDLNSANIIISCIGNKTDKGSLKKGIVNGYDGQLTLKQIQQSL